MVDRIVDFVRGAYTDPNIPVIINNAFVDSGILKMIWGAFVIALIGLIATIKKDDEEVNPNVKWVYGFATLITWFLASNRLFAAIFITVNEKAVYWRSVWLIPVTMTISIFVTMLVFKQEKRINRIVTLVVIWFVLPYIGNFSYANNEFQNADNYYKIPDYALEMIYEVSSDQNDYKKLAGPQEFNVFTRQVDANILLTYDRFFGDAPTYSICYDAINGNTENIYKKALQTRTNYIIVSTDVEQKNKTMEELGFTKLKSNEKYTLYRIDLPEENEGEQK